KGLLALSLPAAAVLGYLCWPDAKPSADAPAPARSVAQTPAFKTAPPPQESEIALAIEQKSIVAEFTGNGRERFKVVLMNKGTDSLKVSVPIGQIFESDEASVVVIRPGTIEVAPGKTRELSLRTAALRASNRLADAQYHLAYLSMPKIEPLLVRIQQDPDLTIAAVQTAILALTDNLPLSSVAKFTPASALLPSRFDTDAFRADTQDIVTALSLLRDIGVRESRVALTIDPQLRIESMIDPTSRPLAMRYYRITSELEWEFWRSELLAGEPATRHYALYGIARFYPDVALEMLPRWAREPRTNPVYRLSAVQALADTQRPEALPILLALQNELGLGTALGKAAKGAADYLDYQLAQNAAARSAVAFRTSRDVEALASAH
ncbi:MAG TPA: hypothetical protein VGO11_11825, partial [Chthoniobacteraceae bacterium]|nr:hypothetical protein [Chthoniobacteraceae bacterium]